MSRKKQPRRSTVTRFVFGIYVAIRDEWGACVVEDAIARGHVANEIIADAVAKWNAPTRRQKEEKTQ